MVSRKVTAATIAAAVTTIVAYVATGLGVTLPAEVQGAITTILVFASGYLRSE